MKIRSKLTEAMLTPSYTATDDTGRVLKPGDKLKDFRGQTWVFKYVSRGPEYNGTAKIVVSKKKGPTARPGDEMEFYDRVLNVTVTPPKGSA
jgi:hypothetical protein